MGDLIMPLVLRKHINLESFITPLGLVRLSVRNKARLIEIRARIRKAAGISNVLVILLLIITHLPEYVRSELAETLWKTRCQQ